MILIVVLGLLAAILFLSAIRARNELQVALSALVLIWVLALIAALVLRAPQ